MIGNEDQCLLQLYALRDLMTERFEHLNDKIDTMFDSRDRALKIANDALEARLHVMNEFRASLSDQSHTFITRAEHTILQDLITATSGAVQIHSATMATKDELVHSIEQRERASEEVAKRVTGLETKFWLGGTGIVLALSLIQVFFNYIHH